MIIAADDIVDWVSDRGDLLIAAWTPQIAAMTDWEVPYAEALAGELHDGMVTSLLRGGTEANFLNLVARSNTGLDPRTERDLAERFFGVTLKLARAAHRHAQDGKATALPFKYGTIVGDARTDPSHLPLADVLLPREHPFWTRWQPPFGMDCRCGTIGMTNGQLARSGRSITPDEALPAIEAQLRDAWPAEFRPLLDFRQPPAPATPPQPTITLSQQQLDDILSAFRPDTD